MIGAEETPLAQRLHSFRYHTHTLAFPSLFKGSTLSHKSGCEVTSFIILYTGGGGVSLADTSGGGGGTETSSQP